MMKTRMIKKPRTKYEMRERADLAVVRPATPSSRDPLAYAAALKMLGEQLAPDVFGIGEDDGNELAQRFLARINLSASRRRTALLLYLR